MKRVLLLSTTTGYQTRSFGDAAGQLGIELVLATDRCHALDDPWRDAAIPIRFHEEEASVAAIVAAARDRPIDGVLALGDRPTAIAAGAASALGLPGHPIDAVRAAGNKLLTRSRLSGAGLLTPWFTAAPLEGSPPDVSALRFPCIVKPLALSGSRGVIRADDEVGFGEAYERLRRLLRQKDVRALRDPANDQIVIEGFIPGAEFAVEGILERGRFKLLAIFDKPDPLDGPFFEETIYVTPSSRSKGEQRSIVQAVASAARALGLSHGPIHAECRLNPDGVYVLEVAARPIGGLCARALRFTDDSEREVPFEEVLLRHALGQPLAGVTREVRASGVMMVPIPKAGYFKKVDGLDEARQIGGVDEIRITAKPDQHLVPLPEGSSYLGFIFARARSAASVLRALRAAHGRLTFSIDASVPLV